MNPKDNWRDVTYRAEGRAKHLGVVEEGQLDTVVLEKENGDLEFVEPGDRKDIRFGDGLRREEVTIPAREIVEERCGKVLDWVGDEEIQARIVSDPSRLSVIAIEFEEEVSYNMLRDMKLIKEDRE